MNKSKIEAGQPEQKLDSEQNADNKQVSPSIANANVVRSPSPIQERTEIFYTYVEDLRKMIEGLSDDVVIQTEVSLRENGDRSFISKIREKTEKDLAWEELSKKRGMH